MMVKFARPPAGGRPDLHQFQENEGCEYFIDPSDQIYKKKRPQYFESDDGLIQMIVLQMIVIQMIVEQLIAA